MKRKYSDEEIKNYIIDREMKNIRKNRQIENIIKTSMKYTEFSIKQKMITRSIEPGFLIKKRQFPLSEIFNREIFSNIYDKLAIKNHRYVYAAVLVLFVIVLTPKIMKQSQQSSFVASEVSEVQESAPVLESSKTKKSVSENILKEVSDNKGKQVELALSGNVAMQNRSEKADVVEAKEKTEKLQIENEVQSAPSVSVEELKSEKSILQDNIKEEGEISMKETSSKSDEISLSRNLEKSLNSVSLKSRMEAKRSVAEFSEIKEKYTLDSFEDKEKKLTIYKMQEELRIENLGSDKIILVAEINEKEMLVDLVILNSDISKEKLKEEFSKLRYELIENGKKISGKVKIESNFEKGVLISLKIIEII